MFLADKTIITNSAVPDMAMIENENISRGVRRMLGLPLDIWTNVMLGSLGIAALAAAVVGVSTYAVVQLQKSDAAEAAAGFEKYKIDAKADAEVKINKARDDANIAIEKVKNDATAEITKANVAIAQANAKALEASAALEKYKAWRTPTAEEQAYIAEAVRPWTGQLVSFSISPGPEPLALMRLLRTLLVGAGWVRAPAQLGDLETDGAGLATAVGVEVQVHPSSAHGTKIAGAANALAAALTAKGIIAAATTNDQLKNPDAINLVVGTKP